jgi:SAM-dependent methyltransferase
MLLYRDLANWWPLLSPPSHYVEEAAELLPLLEPAPGMSLLELGSGGGSLASHLRGQFTLTLTDLSPGMLAVNRGVNPEAEFTVGDMRTLRLGRLFDRVLIHDAIMYMTSADDLRAALTTARLHLRPGGRVVVLPDCVAETFEPETSHGGEDGPDGRGLRYLEWSWDPDPDDTTSEVVYALTLRESDRRVRTVQDHHVEGLFPRATWLRVFEEAGLEARITSDTWRKDVFVAVSGEA